MRKNLLWLTLLVALASLLAPLGSRENDRRAVCRVDLTTSRYEMSSGAPMDWVQEPSQGRAVLKLTLQQYRSARFTLTYGARPEGWTLNVADSSSCNGYGGDGATQSNDAEVQIVGRDLSVWGNDLMIGQPSHKLYDLRDFASDTVVVEVSDGKVTAGKTTWQHPALFALSGQPDKEGPVNYDLYAGFNQVVSGGRTGSGLTSVLVELLP
ncbi:hypothetical protein DYH09_11115 [bacterium CPR1]|nr:hypothetical protein [bacterium CPR1]